MNYPQRAVLQFSRFLAFFLFLGAPFLSSDLLAQSTASGQLKITVPTVLSSCNRDTIFLELSNWQGAKGATYSGNALIEVNVPGGSLVEYQIGSVSSVPTGASEVSYVASKLTISVPLPGLGMTTRIAFVVIPDCDVMSLVDLPYFSGTVTYPAGFPTNSEVFTSILMNVGTPQIVNYIFGSSGILGGNATQLNYVYNSGYGNLNEVTLYSIVPNAMALDSTYLFASPDYEDILITPTSVSAFDANNTLRTYVLTGSNLGSDGMLEAGGVVYLQMFSTVPALCATYNATFWADYTCAGSGLPPCEAPVQATGQMTIRAGTPKLDGTLVSAESPDGCPNKHIIYKVKNNGVGNAAPVGNGYDVNLNITFGSGLLSISNVKLNGIAVPAANISPSGNNSSFSIKLKNLMASDPDGPGGITDLDGDGFYDDMLVVGETEVSFDYTIPCNLVCGANIHYKLSSNATFTDFCGTLNGSTTTALTEFGFRQEQPIEQVNTPNYPILTTGQSSAKNVRYNFKYQQFNMDFTNAVAEIRINYSKKFEIDLASLKFNGVSVTGTKVGTDTQASTTATNPAQTATSNDSAVVIILTAAQVTSLFDAVGDSLSYTQVYYGCDDRQNTTSADNWQLIMRMKPGLCADGSTPCNFDLACKKPYAYGSGNSCPPFQPCFITTNELKRVAPTGYTDITKTTPLLADPGRLYTGDTLQYAIGTAVQYDYPLGPNGAWLNAYGGNNKGGDLYYNFTFNYSVPNGYQGEYPFLFTEKNSKVVVRQRTNDSYGNIGTLGAVLFEAPLLLSDFADWNHVPATVNNNGVFGGYPITPGAGAANCGAFPWDVSYLNCPYEDFYYYGYYGNIVSGRQFNVAQDKVTDAYTIWTGSALARAGWFGDVGDDNYYIEVQTKWVVNPKFPWDNTNSFSTRASSWHYGNGSTSHVGRCNVPAASALAVTKDYYIPNPRATYKPECSLRVSNKIDFKSYSGNYFQNGEVRVPFTVDKIEATIPSEYALTAASNIVLAYNQSCSAQSTTAISASANSGTVTFTKTGGGDFPRVDDCAGLTTAYDLSYTLAKVGSAAPSNYLMPIKIFTKDEWGAVVILYDTLTIAEANPVLTLTGSTPVIEIADGGACTASYVDYEIQNNTLFAAPNTYFAVKSSANSTITNISDGSNVYADPIIAGDITTYGGTNKFVKIGTVGAGDKRIVRIFFQTGVCADQLDVYTDFGCSYPSPLEPNLASTTIQTATLQFAASAPAMVSRPEQALSVSNLCDNKTIRIEIKNTQNANLYKMLAGVKFPSGVSYVAGSAQIRNPTTYTWTTVPSGDVTMPIGDSLAVDLINSAPFNTACGLEGADKGTIYYLRFDVAFTACPPSSIGSILYKIQAENFCGTKAYTRGVVPINFSGTGTQNNYTFSTTPASIKLCTNVGQAMAVTDQLYIKNIGGYGTLSGLSSGKDSVTVVIPYNHSHFSITGLSTSLPFGSPIFGLDPLGNTTMRVLVPAGIAVGDSLAMPLNYNITPLLDTLCVKADPVPLCFVGLFSTPFSIECTAKGLNCTSANTRQLRGSGLSLRTFECCYGSLGDYVWFDLNKDGIQGDMVSEPPIGGVKVYLLNASSGAKLDSTLTTNDGKYLFDSLFSGMYIVQFVAPPSTSFTAVNIGSTTLDSDAHTDGKSGIVPIDVSLADSDIGRNNPTIDAGIFPEKVALGNLVFMDIDGNGSFGPGDMGINDVIVWLFKTGDNPASATPVAKDTTAGGGFYLFDQLDAGTYFVFLPDANFGLGKSLENKISAIVEGGDTNNDDNADENGQNVAISGGIRSTDIVLIANSEPTGETGQGTYPGSLDDDNVNMTVDFGFRCISPDLSASPASVSVCNLATVDLATAFALTDVNNTVAAIGYPKYYADQSDAANDTNPLGSSTVSTSGNYWIRKDVVGGCWDTVSVSLTINPAPIFTLSLPTICPGDAPTVKITLGANADPNPQIKVNGGSAFAFSTLSSGVLTTANGILPTAINTVEVINATSCSSQMVISVPGILSKVCLGVNVVRIIK